MRILICSPTVPYPSTSGFAIRVYQFLQLLARRHSVSLLAYAAPADEAAIEALRAIGPVHPVRRPAATDRSKRRAQLSAMFSPVS